MTGLRISATISLLITISSEFLGGADGIGQRLFNTLTINDNDRMFVYVVTAALLGRACSTVLLGRRTASRPVVAPVAEGEESMSERRPPHPLGALAPRALLVAIWWFASANSTNFYFPPLSQILDEFVEIWFFEGIKTEIWPSVQRLALGFGIAAGRRRRPGHGARRRALARERGPPDRRVHARHAGRRDPPRDDAAARPRHLDEGGHHRAGRDLADPAQHHRRRPLRRAGAAPGGATAYRLSRWDRIRFIVLPNAAPQIFAGARTALAISVVAMVISEMVGTPGGIGYFILDAQRSFNTVAMWTGIIALGILGYLLNKLFALVEGWALAWHRGMTAHNNGGK